MNESIGSVNCVVPINKDGHISILERIHILIYRNFRPPRQFNLSTRVEFNMFINSTYQHPLVRFNWL